MVKRQFKKEKHLQRDLNSSMRKDHMLESCEDRCRVCERWGSLEQWTPQSPTHSAPITLPRVTLSYDPLT